MTHSQAIWRPHATVATVVQDPAGRFLLVEELIHGKLYYNQPAGHLEPDETLAAAARREALEETACDIDLDCFIGAYQWYSPVHEDHILRFAFAGHIRENHPGRTLDAGIQRTVWMSRAEIAALGEKLRSPLVLVSIDDWLAGQRLPLTTLKSLLPTAGEPA